MKIIGKMENAPHTGVIDSKESTIVFIFDDDDELQTFIGKLISTKVIARGLRIASIPFGLQEDHPLIDLVFRLIQSGDGFIDGKGITDEARKDLPTPGEIDNLK